MKEKTSNKSQPHRMTFHLANSTLIICFQLIGKLEKVGESHRLFPMDLFNLQLLQQVSIMESQFMRASEFVKVKKKVIFKHSDLIRHYNLFMTLLYTWICQVLILENFSIAWRPMSILIKIGSQRKLTFQLNFMLDSHISQQMMLLELKHQKRQSYMLFWAHQQWKINL
jgi:hypothetical protein